MEVDGREPVRAAGGVVWRRGPGGEAEVLVVHRPKHRDWSFPKGKRDDGESDEECALREVEEETGLRCELGRELAGTRYTDRNGRDKVVRYWAMTVGSGRLTMNDEVDDAEWLPLAAAAARLSYERDRAVLDSFVAARLQA